MPYHIKRFTLFKLFCHVRFITQVWNCFFFFIVCYLYLINYFAIKKAPGTVLSFVPVQL